MTNIELAPNKPPKRDHASKRERPRALLLLVLLCLLIVGFWFFDRDSGKLDQTKSVTKSKLSLESNRLESNRVVANTPIEMPLPSVPASAPSPNQKSLTVQRVLKVRDVYRRIGGARLAYRPRQSTISTPVRLDWLTTEPESNYRIEISKNREFQSSWKELQSQGSSVEVADWKVGRNFWRVSRDGVTWSETAEVSIRPIFLTTSKPTVNAGKNRYAAGSYADLRFQDAGVERVRAWVLEGSKHAEFPETASRTILLADSRASIKLEKVGTYFFRIRSVNESGEISAFSKAIAVDAIRPSRRRVIPALQIRMARNAPKAVRKVPVEETVEKAEVAYSAREIANEEEIVPSTIRLRSAVTKKPVSDQTERPWELTLEGGTGARVSSELLNPGANAAQAHFLGLGLQYQWKQSSVFANFYSKVAGVNAAGDAQQNLKLDFRYNRWWRTSWNWFEFGWASGAEFMQNSGQVNFSPGYSILKTGAASRLRLGSRWRSQGEALVGGWIDGNRAYEFSGQLGYDLRRDMTLGVGYRVHLFEAGSESSSPRGLPYREALGEIFSSLKISF